MSDSSYPEPLSACGLCGCPAPGGPLCSADGRYRSTMKLTSTRLAGRQHGSNFMGSF